VTFKAGITLASLVALARSTTDLDSMQEMLHKKSRLFDTFKAKKRRA
jgi:hypothetical protein